MGNGCVGRGCGERDSHYTQFNFVRKYLITTGATRVNILNLLEFSKDLPPRLNPAKYRVLINRLEIDIPFDTF